MSHILKPDSGHDAGIFHKSLGQGALIWPSQAGSGPLGLKKKIYLLEHNF